jgi:DoxX-like family
VLNLVPRHQEIVGRIVGDSLAKPLTISIGLAEIFMAIWIISGYKTRQNTVLQIVIVAGMNILEFVFVPDLLLWGKFNAIFASIFILIVYYNEFVLHKKLILQK